MDNELLIAQGVSYSCPCLCYLFDLKNPPYVEYSSFAGTPLLQTFNGSLFLLQSRVFTWTFKAFYNQISSYHFRLIFQCSIILTLCFRQRGYWSLRNTFHFHFAVLLSKLSHPLPGTSCALLTTLALWFQSTSETNNCMGTFSVISVIFS